MRGAFRAIKAQLRATVGAILAIALGSAISVGTERGTEFAARALGMTRRGTFAANRRCLPSAPLPQKTPAVRVRGKKSPPLDLSLFRDLNRAHPGLPSQMIQMVRGWRTQTLGVELTRYIRNPVVLPDSIDVEKFVEVGRVYRFLSASKMYTAVPFF